MVVATFDSSAAAHREVDTSKHNVRRWRAADFKVCGEVPNKKQLQPSVREHNMIERISRVLDAIVFCHSLQLFLSSAC